MFAALLFATSLIAGQLGPQWLEPRERYDPPATVQVSQGVMRSLMLNHVAPNYPREARKKGIGGTVLLNVAVDEKGHTSDIKVVSGHPLLVPLALEAVKRLRFRPYRLNGNAVPIEGYVSYVFQILPHGKASVSLGPAQ